MGRREEVVANNEDVTSSMGAQADNVSYLADTPISSLKEDRLGRSRFAQHLGDAILAWKSDDSIVIGLYGRWGLGKTSILNMVVDILSHQISFDNSLFCNLPYCCCDLINYLELEHPFYSIFALP